MKHLHRTFLLLLSSLVFSSSFAQILKGTIQNSRDYPFVYFDYLSGFTQIKDSASVAGNQQFTKRFSFTTPQIVSLRYGSMRKDIYVFPGADLQLRFDAANDSLFAKTFSVSGDYGINHYLDSFPVSMRTGYTYLKMKRSNPIDSLTPILSMQRHFLDSARSAYFKSIHQNRNTKALRDFFVIDSINAISSALLTGMDFLHFIEDGNKLQFFKNEIENRVPLSFSSLYPAADLYKAFWYYYPRTAYELATEYTDSATAVMISKAKLTADFIQAKHIDGKLRDFAVTQSLLYIFTHYSEGTVEEAMREDSSIEELISMVADTVLTAKLTSEYGNKKALVRTRLIGTKAPGFSLTDTAGNIVTLKDFSGKTVLIDVWASWCSPCIEEMPYLSKIVERLKDKNDFVLLSVSIDTDKEAWINNGVQRVHPPGIPLWEGETGNFSKNYNIGLIPQLVLLDKDGNYIDFNPPRASNGDKLYELLIQHLAP